MKSFKQLVQMQLFQSKGDISFAYSALKRVIDRTETPDKIKEELIKAYDILVNTFNEYDKIVGWRKKNESSD